MKVSRVLSLIFFAAAVCLSGQHVYKVEPYTDYMACPAGGAGAVRLGGAGTGASLLAVLPAGGDAVLLNSGACDRVVSDAPVKLIPALNYLNALPEKKFVAPGENIALHKSYVLAQKPNYPLCLNDADKTELTDGFQVSDMNMLFWCRKTTVGWMSPNKTVQITVDLKKEEQIGGAGCNMAAGVSGVYWPNHIYILISSDGRSWRLAGDLIDLGAEYGGLPSMYGQGQVREFVTDRLNARGRYVQFVFRTSHGAMTFIDELKIWRGKSSAASSASGPVVKVADLPVRAPVRMLLLQRLRADADRLLQNLAEVPGLADDTRRDIREKIGQRYRQAAGRGIMLKEVRPVFPLDETHESLLAMNSLVLQAAGFQKPFFWKSDRWENTSISAVPRKTQEAGELGIEMMTGEVRADALNITNPSGQTMKIRAEIRGLKTPVELSLVQVTDTTVLKPASAVLHPLQKGESFAIAPGCTGTLWISCRMPQGKTRVENGRLRLYFNGGKKVILFRLKIHQMDFPRKPTLLLGGWDYLIGDGGYYGNAGMMKQKIEFMKSYGLNTAWGHAGVLPREDRYDREGKLLNADKLNWKMFDEWIIRWKPVRKYCIFVNTLYNRFGEKEGTPRFEKMVGDYYRQIFARAEKLGVKSSQMVFELVDEPTSRTAVQKNFLPWFQAFKKAGLPIEVMENPLNIDDVMKHSPELFKLADIICFNLDHSYYYEPKVTQARLKVMQQVAETDRKIWLYMCDGPSQTLDPVTYYRGISWHAAKYNAKAIMFWAMGSTGGSGSLWNPYYADGIAYSPFFVDDRGCSSSRQMEAIREGMQDFEYIAMTQNRIRELKTQGRQQQAALGEKCLQKALDRLNAEYRSGCFSWNRKKRSGDFLETSRLELLHWLVENK